MAGEETIKETNKMPRKLGSKDKKKRKRSQIEVLLRASALPAIGTVAGAASGVGLAYLGTRSKSGSRKSNNPAVKTLQFGTMLASGGLGGYIGNKAGTAVSVRTINRERYFTPQSKEKQYRITEDDEQTSTKEIYKKLSNPFSYLSKI